MIHVVLLTCERREYTARTVETFLDHNRDTIGAFKLWHCDDASADKLVRRIPADRGFQPLIHTPRRVGVTQMVRQAARKLEHAGAEWMLLLENDWETARAFPWAIFDLVRARGDVWALRLYGQWKERDRQLPAGTRHRGRNGADPKWQTHYAHEQINVTRLEDAEPRFAAGKGEPYEIGDIHWGNPPSVAKVPLVAWLHKSASREKDAIVRSGQITDHAARVVENVVYHIGDYRTPEFRQ